MHERGDDLLPGRVGRPADAGQDCRPELWRLEPPEDAAEGAAARVHRLHVGGRGLGELRRLLRDTRHEPRQPRADTREDDDVDDRDAGRGRKLPASAERQPAPRQLDERGDEVGKEHRKDDEQDDRGERIDEPRSAPSPARRTRSAGRRSGVREAGGGRIDMVCYARAAD